MPVSVSEAEVSIVSDFLMERQLKHLRCRQRGAALIVESGPQDDAYGHLRLRKLSPTNWAADQFHHTGRWTPLPIQASLTKALQVIEADFLWVLEE